MNNSSLRAVDGASHPAIDASTPSIKIDKGIPVPVAPGRGNHGHGGAGALRAMEVGDSFLYPAATGKMSTLSNASRHGSTLGKALGRKFACRTVTENGQKVVRVWRVS